jgi:steroid delta-isomerase-like uncharacterized protein
LGEAAKAVVRRNTEEVQGGGNFEVFEELFADDFLDHTPQPGRTPDKDGARQLYKILRTAFPDFHADIHWQLADGDRVTTYKTYHGTHRGEFLGVAATGHQIQFETVDVMRVRNGKITEHWAWPTLSLAQHRRLAGQARARRFCRHPSAQRAPEHHMTIGIGSGAIGTALHGRMLAPASKQPFRNSRGSIRSKSLFANSPPRGARKQRRPTSYSL